MRESLCESVRWVQQPLVCSRLLCCFFGGESLRSHSSESASDLPFSKGVTRSDPLRTRRLPCVSRISGPQPLLSPVRTEKKTTIAQQTCVTCLRTDRCLCSERAHAHTHASRDGARNHSTSAHSALDLTLACEPEAVLEIIAPPLILPSTPVVPRPSSHVKGSRTPVGHPLALFRAAHPRALPHPRGLNTCAWKGHSRLDTFKRPSGLSVHRACKTTKRSTPWSSSPKYVK